MKKISSVTILILALTFTTGCGRHVSLGLQEESVVEGTTYAQAETALKAVETDDSTTLLKILDEGFDINHHFESNNGRTLLIQAVIFSKIALVELLMDRRADPDMKDNSGNNSFHYAQGQADVERLLSGKKDNLDDLGALLLTSVREGDVDGFKDAIERGAEVNFQSNGGVTALMIVAENGNTVILRLLSRIDGVDYNLRNTEGKTALTIAEENNQKRIAKFIKKKGGVS